MALFYQIPRTIWYPTLLPGYVGRFVTNPATLLGGAVIVGKLLLENSV